MISPIEIVAILDKMISEIELIKQSIELPNRNIRFDRLNTVIYKQLGLTFEEMKAKDRSRHLVEARCIVIKDLFENGYGKSEIAFMLDCRHSTVIHQLNNWDSLITDAKFAKKQLDFTKAMVQAESEKQEWINEQALVGPIKSEYEELDQKCKKCKGQCKVCP